MDAVLGGLFDEACSLEETDAVRASELILLLAQKGYAPAQVKVAAFLRASGDHEEAMKLLRAAAEQEYTPGMVLLGSELFICGSTPEKEQGASLIRKAAEKGDALAQQWRGIMSLMGGETKAAGLLLNVKLEQAVCLVRASIQENMFGDMATAKEFYKEADLPSVTAPYLRNLKFSCTVCKKQFHNEKKLQVCGACKGPRYCGIACQKKDWPKHKAVCRKNE